MLKRRTARGVRMYLLVLIALCLGAASSNLSDDVSPVVTTASGKVRGTVQYTNDLPDKPVYTFKGIPYAAPPVGDLRFRAPQPAAPWEGIMDATELGPYCPQDEAMLKAFDITHVYQQPTTNEDCLTLNVETPSLQKNAVLPVLLWLHGGGLFAGAGGMWPYASLAAHQDVVVVTINYRLGPLGFLSTGDENAPGNFGLLDQVQAMRWVQENIRNFGGDPDRVTIFGTSAGGASVCYHVVYPLSKGLFQRAISQSGVCIDSHNPKPLERAAMFAEDLGCDTEHTASMVTCLRQKSSDELLAGHRRLQMKLRRQGVLFPFVPVIDGTYIPCDPKDILDKCHLNVAQYLLGVNDHEFGFRMPSGAIPNFGQGMTEEDFIFRVGMLVRKLYPASKQDDIIAALREEYSYHGNTNNPMAIQYQFTQVYGDQFMVAPTVFVAEQYAGHGQVYLYENRYVSSVASAGRPDWVGCDHTDELPIISGLAFLDMPPSDTDQSSNMYSNEDKKTSLDMMAYWANFARTGNPSDGTGGPADSPTVPEWPQYTPDNPAYMKLDVTSSSDVGLKPEKMELWNDVFPKLAASSDRDEL
ncbi:carboxylesterase 1D-like [Branchiostoma floridae x Branchiostoma japonicum]